MSETTYLRQIRDALRGHDGTLSGILGALVGSTVATCVLTPTFAWLIWNHLAAPRGLYLVSWWECFWAVMLIEVLLPMARKVIR